MVESLEKTVIYLAYRLSVLDDMLEGQCALNRQLDAQNKKLRKENAEQKQKIADFQALNIVNNRK